MTIAKNPIFDATEPITFTLMGDVTGTYEYTSGNAVTIPTVLVTTPAASVAWFNVTGKPTEFAPSAHTHTVSDITDFPTQFTPTPHTHAISDVTGLQAALNAKQDTITVSTFDFTTLITP